MENVTTRYFKTLPVLTGATGNATLKDDHFNLNITSGQAALESGATLSLASGRFEASDLLSKEVPGLFTFDIRGPLENMIAFARHPALNVITADMEEADRLRGDAQAILDLKLPLIKDVPKERVKATTTIVISNAAMSNAMPGVDISDGNFKVQST